MKILTAQREPVASISTSASPNHNTQRLRLTLCKQLLTLQVCLRDGCRARRVTAARLACLPRLHKYARFPQALTTTMNFAARINPFRAERRSTKVLILWDLGTTLPQSQHIKYACLKSSVFVVDSRCCLTLLRGVQKTVVYRESCGEETVRLDLPPA